MFNFKQKPQEVEKKRKKVKKIQHDYEKILIRRSLIYD